MSSQRYRRRADAAFAKRAAQCRQLREDEQWAKQMCMLRPSVNNHHTTKTTPQKAAWDASTETTRRPLMGHLINQRLGDFVRAPPMRYVHSYYEGYYTEPFSHKSNRQNRARRAERLIQERLSSASAACRIRKTVEYSKQHGDALDSPPPRWAVSYTHLTLPTKRIV